MPVPASVLWGSGALRLDSTTTMVVVRHSDDRLTRAVARFRGRLESRSGTPLPHALAPAADSASATVRFDVANAGQLVQSVDEDEGYSIVVDSVHATLQSTTVVGALRGMETLVQLLTLRDGHYELPAVFIQDVPRYRWRGLLVDVGRHFIPIEGIKRTLDGMAAVKLNVLHWHLTDDQGFRVQSKRYPKLQALGSDGEFYTQEQIGDVVAYARDLGIRVVPEFDMPSHSTTWFIGYPQFASIPGKYEIVRTFGGGTASFDPTREETYRFIDRFIGEMVTLFPDPYWHVGGDEVTDAHWNRSARVRAYKRRNKMRTNDELQAYFNHRLTTILSKYKKRM
ncbi:MAG: family 20 glycosylhydrolase, partial [Gemmatimonadaceae bacterium]